MRLRQCLRQRQPEAGAGATAVEIGVDLPERHQDLAQMFRFDADPGVGNDENQVAAFADRAIQRHFAASWRELDGIGQQIDDHLLQHSSVGQQGGKVRLHRRFNGQTGLCDSFGQDRKAGLDQIGKGKNFLVKRLPTRFDPRQVQDVVDDRQQVTTGPVNVFDVLGRSATQPTSGAGAAQHVGEADDRVEWCAQFVAHIGKELSLGAVGCLRLDHCRASEVGRSLSLLLGGEERHFCAVALNDPAKLLGVLCKQRVSAVLGTHDETPQFDELMVGYPAFGTC